MLLISLNQTSSSSSSSFIRHNKVRNIKLMKHTDGKTYQAYWALTALWALWTLTVMLHHVAI